MTAFANKYLHKGANIILARLFINQVLATK